jgi:hypothetical protein
MRLRSSSAISPRRSQQASINDDLRTCIQDQREFTRQQLTFNADVRTTLARLETLMARMLSPGENGTDA